MGCRNRNRLDRPRNATAFRSQSRAFTTVSSCHEFSPSALTEAIVFYALYLVHYLHRGRHQCCASKLIFSELIICCQGPKGGRRNRHLARNSRYFGWNWKVVFCRRSLASALLHSFCHASHKTDPGRGSRSYRRTIDRFSSSTRKKSRRNSRKQRSVTRLFWQRRNADAHK